MSKLSYSNIDPENLQDLYPTFLKTVRPSREVKPSKKHSTSIIIHLRKEHLKQFYEISQSLNSDPVLKELKEVEGNLIYEVKFKEELKSDLNKLKLLFNTLNIRASFSVKSK